MVSLKTMKKQLSVRLWTLLTLNDYHIGYVVEGEGLLFKLEQSGFKVVKRKSFEDDLRKCN